MENITLRDIGRDLEKFWQDLREVYREGGNPELFRYLGAATCDGTPNVDVYRSDDHFTLVAELPGLTEKDIDIQVQEGKLTITGKYPVREREGETLVRREGIEGDFCRSFELPEDVDSEHIQASFKNGILELKLPRTGKAPEKRIKVEVH